MKFKLEIDLDNAAFDDAPAAEVARILDGLSHDLRSFGDPYFEMDGPSMGFLHDINGNRIGVFRVEAG